MQPNFYVAVLLIGLVVALCPQRVHGNPFANITARVIFSTYGEVFGYNIPSTPSNPIFFEDKRDAKFGHNHLLTTYYAPIDTNHNYEWSVAYSKRFDHLYYGKENSYHIFRSAINGSSPTLIHTTTYPLAGNRFAVDDKHGFLYYMCYADTSESRMRTKVLMRIAIGPNDIGNKEEAISYSAVDFDINTNEGLIIITERMAKISYSQCNISFVALSMGGNLITRSRTFKAYECEFRRSVIVVDTLRSALYTGISSDFFTWFYKNNTLQKVQPRPQISRLISYMAELDTLLGIDSNEVQGLKFKSNCSNLCFTAYPLFRLEFYRQPTSLMVLPCNETCSFDVPQSITPVLIAVSVTLFVVDMILTLVIACVSKRCWS